MDSIKILIKKSAHGEDLPIPQYMTGQSAGVDLLAAVEAPIVLQPGEIKLIPTGIHIALPEGFEAQIRPRSGLALKHGISLVNTPGTIDADYRGEISLIMINFGAQAFTINRGERVAQMVLNKVERINFQLVEELTDTDRGTDGFGHTGQ